MAQFKVPQNLDLQDKIVGPLTLFQFIYLLLGGMIFYATLRTGPVWLFIILGIPSGLISLALAFIKVNDQPFAKFLGSLLLFLIQPKSRVWHRGPTPPQISFDTTGGRRRLVPRKIVPKERFNLVAQSLDRR